jgi:catechol 2,3-dioxygenase-like lactoylglutathione lyase family enzyme
MLESRHIVAFAAATGLHRARAFYERVLGLRVAERNDFACVIANGTMLRIAARARSLPGWLHRPGVEGH